MQVRLKMNKMKQILLVVLPIIFLISCNINANDISKDKVVKECVTKDEYNETHGFGAECKNIQDCKEKINKMISLNPKIGNLSESEENNLDCLISSYKAIPYSSCQTKDDCFKSICGGEWCKTGLQDFVYIKCISNICVGLKYFIEGQFK